MEEHQVIGPWRKIKVLGYGGFGQVTLWNKKGTEEYVAIKRPQENELKSWIKDKHMERWCKEIEIMKKLDHMNIVKALTIPTELESLSNLPMLAMEYCCLGDLRQVLNKPENCCGLKEPTVIKILKDISSGLAYLHSCKVIHRDLKPDNIVLQRKNDVITYKLIDLGYAKELDQSSVCKSFVGTVQYLAPEFFLGKLYSCSVDYWSFGILAHEIITGYRPFLPGSNPPEWMKQVQNKQRNVISVVENTDGSIIYSTSISRVNHMSRCFLQDIEKWLQLALDWDGETRGKDPQTNEVVFFDVLNEILDKTILKVFSLSSYDIVSYEITPVTTVLTLKSWLQRDTGIAIIDQILLLKGGRYLDSASYVMDFLNKEDLKAGSVPIFLYNYGTQKMRSRVVLKPIYAKELLEDPKKALSYKHLKRSCSDSVFLLESELQLFDCLMEAIKAKIMNIQGRRFRIVEMFDDLLYEWSQVESFEQFMLISHKADLDRYMQLRKQGLVSGIGAVQKWINNVMYVQNRIADMTIAPSRESAKISLEKVEKMCDSLEENEFVRSYDRNVLSGLLNESLKVWENVQKIPKENRNALKPNTEMVKILYRCVEFTTNLLRSPLLDLLFLKFSQVDDLLTDFLVPLSVWLRGCRITLDLIERTQKQRQQEVWSMGMTLKAQELARMESHQMLKKELWTQISEIEGNGVKKEGEENVGLIPLPAPRPVCYDAAYPFHEVFQPNFKIMEPVLVPHKTDFELHHDYSMRDLDSESIINTNNYLRSRVEKINESWSSLLLEMKSINWDSLSE